MSSLRCQHFTAASFDTIIMLLPVGWPEMAIKVNEYEEAKIGRKLLPWSFNDAKITLGCVSSIYTE
jgi:hypothetical protein